MRNKLIAVAALYVLFSIASIVAVNLIPDFTWQVVAVGIQAIVQIALASVWLILFKRYLEDS